MKVLLVVNNLSGGGAEKVAVDLANLFCKNNITSILTLSDKEDKFSVDSSVSRLKLNLKSNSRTVLSGIKANITRITKLRATILKEEPDVVITFMNRTNIRVLISLLFTKIPIIITEHNYPKTNPMSRSWELLRRVLYKRAYKLVSVSSGISDYFSFLPEKKKEVIYNPTELHFLEDKSLLDLSKKNIIAMGRLVPLKGFDLLIKAFSLIAEDYPNWNLSFIGDGPERNSLIKLIESYGLEKHSII
ncbi:MAG: hypothetical protein B6229_06205 [Spirochaetaceae bacterium 4572_7]|nr:MAG: hypothetical protein B6229_06205 [Spirochaetaceae bacterium 4572_7]